MHSVQKGGHFCQVDKRWASVPWRVPRMANTLWTLAQRLNDWPKGNGNGTRKRISLALATFSRNVRTTIRKRPNVTSDGTLGASGCYLVSMANTLRFLNVPIYGHVPTPDVLLQNLQLIGAVSLVDCSCAIGFDSLGILTKGRVQLVGTEDWGRSGILPRQSPILRGLCRGEAAIANVCSHGVFGTAKRKHYVLLTGKTGNDWRMEDPALREASTLLEHFPRVYAVWLYCRVNVNSRKNGRR